LYGLATSACAEAMLTMRPHFRAFISGSARRIVWNDAVRLSAMIAFHLATGNSSIGATNWMPALFTRHVDRAEHLDGVAHHRLDRVLLRKVGVVVAHGDAVIGRELRAELLDFGGFAEAVQHDVGALASERRRDAEADTARSSR
jgi:hypothetical protein